MKTKIIAVIALLVMGGMSLYAQDNKILVAYFSWSGNTQYVAEQIAKQTGGTLFRIEPVKPYPHGIHPLHRGGKERKGGQCPSRHQKQGGELGQLRHHLYRMPRMVVDCPDDYQYLH